MDVEKQTTRPIRILHVPDSMDRAGIETWLLHVLRHINRDRFKMDFLYHTDRTCDYDDEILSLGSNIIPCLHPHVPCIFAANFRRVMRDWGPYDVVHSHVHHFSGFVLKMAHRAKVPLRISHSHNDTSSIEGRSGWVRHTYLSLMKRWIDLHSNLGLAASQKAAIDLYGPDWRSKAHRRILYCGVDLSPFLSPCDAKAVRTELGIPSRAFVIGHVGRFDRQKNHEFLIDVFFEVLKREPGARLLLVGDGTLRPAIERRMIPTPVSDRVMFLGSRPDVPRLMRGAMDVFLFPSLYEGLGLALVESQAAGLPSVVSDVIPEEADVVKPLVRRLSLSQPASSWAEEILAHRATRNTQHNQEAIDLVLQSPFNIDRCVKSLEQLYEAPGV